MFAPPLYSVSHRRSLRPTHLQVLAEVLLQLPVLVLQPLGLLPLRLVVLTEERQPVLQQRLLLRQLAQLRL